MNIKQEFIPRLPRNAYRNGKGAYEGVVAHATANYGDTAKGNRDYEVGNWQNAFVHFFVDYNEIIQVADTNYKAWGAGSVANDRFVHVELCQSRDKQKFLKSYKKYTWLLAKVLHDKRLGVNESTLWGHQDVTDKLGGTNHTDPYGYLAIHGVSKAQFFADVKKEYDKMDKPSVADWKYGGIEYLAANGLLEDLDGWKEKVDEPMETWAVTLLLKRIHESVK